jgi:hypothetical protein
MVINNSLKVFLIFWCLLTLVSPIFLLWNIEISMEFKPDVYLTNGFYNINPIQIYHRWIYLTLLTDFGLIIFVLMNLEKFIK